MEEPKAAIQTVEVKTEERGEQLREGHKFTASRAGEWRTRAKERRHPKVKANIYKPDRHYISIK